MRVGSALCGLHGPGAGHLMHGLRQLSHGLRQLTLAPGELVLFLCQLRQSLGKHRPKSPLRQRLVQLILVLCELILDPFQLRQGVGQRSPGLGQLRPVCEISDGGGVRNPR
jgi:hypothetical protein